LETRTFKLAFFGVDHDAVAFLDQSDGAAGGRFGRHVADAQAARAAENVRP